MLLIPLLALCALEGFLRLVGYGYSTSLFKPRRIGGEDFLIENDKFSLRFFPPELARSPGPFRMKAHKAPGSYRIFILGESAAMGDPEPAYGAGRYLEVLLRERFPAATFDVVNVAFTAINSHVILPIARECAAQEGDLWIIYMGNNEMVGPFGAATVFGARAAPVELVRAGLAIQRTRLGQLLAGARRLVKGRSASPSWGGMQMFLGNQVPPDSPLKEPVYRGFQKNLRDILRVGGASGANILLNTVAVNLRDCPPFGSAGSTSSGAGEFDQLLAEAGSLEGQGRLVEAGEHYAEAAHLNPLSATAQYGYGVCLLQMTNLAAAAAHFQAACDLDAMPFRADSKLNGLIAEAARQAANPKLVLFDAAKWLGTNSPAGIPGQEFFYEHVHLNFDGNYRLALGWAEKVASLLPGSLRTRDGGNWASQEMCERRLGLTDWNRAIVVGGVIGRMQQPPLSRQPNNGSRVKALESWLAELRRGMGPGAGAGAREIYRQALERAPGDECLHENFASFLVATGDLPAATEQWQRVRDLMPQDYLACYRVGELLWQQGKLSEAQSNLVQATVMRPYLADPWIELGKVHIAQGKFEQALRVLERARQLRPADPQIAYESGRGLALCNRREEAIRQFRQAVELKPDYWEAHDALGGQLGLAGNVGESKSEFEQVVRLRPEYPRAHLNLGVALLKQGRGEVAVREFEEALRLEPTNTVAREYLRQAQAAARR